MCGYLRREISQERYDEFLRQFDLELGSSHIRSSRQDFYPAIAGYVDRQIDDVIIRQSGQLRSVSATWWYDCHLNEGKVVAGHYESFNARNLDSSFWRNAIRRHRGLVVATGLGESKKLPGHSKSSFLMTSKEPFFLGLVYKPLAENIYSAAVITRNKHPRFEKYHDKAFPLFLPKDKSVIDLWLGEADDSDPVISELLNNPKLYADLEVLEVKSFKSGEPRTKKTVSEMLFSD